MVTIVQSLVVVVLCELFVWCVAYPWLVTLLAHRLACKEGGRPSREFRRVGDSGIRDSSVVGCPSLLPRRVCASQSRDGRWPANRQQCSAVAATVTVTVMAEESGVGLGGARRWNRRSRAHFLASFASFASSLPRFSRRKYIEPDLAELGSKKVAFAKEVV